MVRTYEELLSQSSLVSLTYCRVDFVVGTRSVSSRQLSLTLGHTVSGAAVRAILDTAAMHLCQELLVG